MSSQLRLILIFVPVVSQTTAQLIAVGKYDIGFADSAPVMKLIADGASNTDIADRLVISEKTVKSHVSNILSKLHVLDRTQAAVYAWREGVVRRE